MTDYNVGTGPALAIVGLTTLDLNSPPLPDNPDNFQVDVIVAFDQQQFDSTYHVGWRVGVGAIDWVSPSFSNSAQFAYGICPDGVTSLSLAIWKDALSSPTTIAGAESGAIDESVHLCPQRLIKLN